MGWSGAKDAEMANAANDFSRPGEITVHFVTAEVPVHSFNEIKEEVSA